jgi:PadR family transcriptional regulator, regulatory protein PadR
MKADNAKAQMRRGVLELCVLNIIGATAEAYPSDILERLKASDLIVVEGTLYPLLTRLKDAGLLDYTWQESLTGPPRKYYRLTESGRETQIELQSSWHELVQSVSQTIQNETTHE